MLFKLSIIVFTTISLLSFAISGDTFEIESLWSDYGPVAYDYGYDDIAFTLKTDVPYASIDWYIDFPDDDEGYKYQKTIHGNGTSTHCDFHPDSLPGAVTSNEYTIKAIAYFYDADGNSVSDTDTYDIVVFKPIVLTQTKRELMDNKPKYFPDVYGYVKLYGYYRIGNAIYMDYYISAYFKGDQNDRYTVWAECKNTIFGLKPSVFGSSGWKKIHKKDRSMTVSDSVLNSLDGGENREYTCEAYIRLVVQGGDKEDNYHEPKFPYQVKLRPE